MLLACSRLKQSGLCFSTDHRYLSAAPVAACVQASLLLCLCAAPCVQRHVSRAQCCCPVCLLAPACSSHSACVLLPCCSYISPLPVGTAWINESRRRLTPPEDLQPCDGTTCGKGILHHSPGYILLSVYMQLLRGVFTLQIPPQGNCPKFIIASGPSPTGKGFKKPCLPCWALGSMCLISAQLSATFGRFCVDIRQPGSQGAHLHCMLNWGMSTKLPVSDL